jgi:hypothetical protein
MLIVFIIIEHDSSAMATLIAVTFELGQRLGDMIQLHHIDVVEEEHRVLVTVQRGKVVPKIGPFTLALPKRSPAARRFMELWRQRRNQPSLLQHLQRPQRHPPPSPQLHWLLPLQSSAGIIGQTAMDLSAEPIRTNGLLLWVFGSIRDGYPGCAVTQNIPSPAIMSRSQRHQRITPRPCALACDVDPLGSTRVFH